MSQKKSRKRMPEVQPRKDWPFQYAMVVLLGILAALAILTREWSVIGASATAVLLAYWLKREWEK